MEELTKNMDKLSKIDISYTEYLSNIYNKIIFETKNYVIYDNYNNRYDYINIFPNWLYNLDINTQKKIIFAFENRYK
tara:strand:- start:193 stop:423 length:231 start_codon:yes stop_codon:yes gene_type:complete